MLLCKMSIWMLQMLEAPAGLLEALPVLAQLLITANSLQKSLTLRFPTIPVWKWKAALAPAGLPPCFIHADELFQHAVISSTLSAGAADRWDLLLHRPSRTHPPEPLSLPAAGEEGGGGGRGEGRMPNLREEL